MKTTVRIALSLTVAAGLLTMLMVWSGVSPREVWATIERLPLSVYLLALACHMTVYVLRALRFRSLIPSDSRPTLTRALAVSAAHNLASYVLPAKTGEASIIVYLRRVCGVRSSIGLASLVVSRLLDGAVLCGGLAVACLTLGFSGKYEDSHWFHTKVVGAYGANEMLQTVGSILAVLTLLFVGLSMRGDWLVRLPARIARTFGLGKRPGGQRILEKVASVATALRSAGAGGQLWVAFLTSVPIWGGVFAFYALLGPAMGLPDSVGFAEATFGASLAMMSNLLPINGIAGFGTQETGWSFGFGLLGVPTEIAVSTGAGVHLVQLFNVVVMGILGHLAMGFLTRDELSSTEDSNPIAPS